MCTANIMSNPFSWDNIGKAASFGMMGFGVHQNLKGASATAAYQIQQAAAQTKQLNYEANVAELNAQYAKEDARRVLAEGYEAISDIYSFATKVASSQTATVADSGFVVGEGTSLDIMKSTNLMAEMDARIIRENAYKQSWGFEREALNLKSKAKFLRAAGEDVMKAGGMAAKATILGGSTQAGASIYDYYFK